MLFPNCLEYSILSVLVFTALAVGYDASANTNIAMYFGQGPGENELGLSHFCDSSSVDIIPLGFMNRYIAQANGYPGTNFGGSCWADNYTAPGYNGVNNPKLNDLKKKCPTMVSGIPYCQSLGKKILLSLGGQVFKENSYALTSAKDAEYMADFLWGAFGPFNSSANWPRPFDTEEVVNEVDGFDFDIEHVNPGEQEYYIILIERLRGYFENADKQYLITGAPQCNFPDLQMGDIINQVQFDMLFIQYYDTAECSAREWVKSNPGYGISTNLEKPSGFKNNFDALVASLPASKSKNTKLYIGLLGSNSSGVPGDYLSPASEVAPLIKARFCNPYFGGIMIFDAGHSEVNVGGDGKPFYEEIKNILLEDSIDTKDFTCATTGTLTTETASPTGGMGGAGGGGVGNGQLTTITMTLCPSGLGSFSTPTIYANATSKLSIADQTSAFYTNSSSTFSTAANSTTIALPPSSSSLTKTSSTIVITRTKTSIYVLTTCAPIFGACAEKTTTLVTESHVLFDTQIVRRMVSASGSGSSSSSSSATNALNASLTTISSRSSNSNNSAAATPTYSFNLNTKPSNPSNSSATPSNSCFIVIVTLSVPVAVAPCTSTPSATGKPAAFARTSGSSPLGMGSRLFFVFSVGVPGTFGVFWYLLGRVLL